MRGGDVGEGAEGGGDEGGGEGMFLCSGIDGADELVTGIAEYGTGSFRYSR